jgi:transcriptional regulator with XRE-family HTH domain
MDILTNLILEGDEMTFAEKLRELRDSKGISEVKLAELSGLPYGTVHTYVMGRRKPSFTAVLKLAKALGTDCTAFAECDDLKADEPEDEKPNATKARKGKK